MTIDLHIESVTQFQQDSLRSKVLNRTQQQSNNGPGMENHIFCMVMTTSIISYPLTIILFLFMSPSLWRD